MANREVVAKVQNAVLYSDGCIRIDNVRASYPHLDEPYKSEGDDGNTKEAFSIDGLMPKETHKAAKDLVKKAIEDLLQKNDAKVGSSFWFLKDGDKLFEEDDSKSTLQGNFVIKSSEKRRPAVRNRDGSIMSEREIGDKIYGGCWVNVLLRPWYFSGKASNGKTYPKRVLANLIAVQFVRDDDAFGEGRISDEGVFDSASDDNDSDDDGL